MRRPDDRDERRRRGRRRGAPGFTLVELLVVIAIIGLLMSLILVAAADGVRRAEERATQSLITKLETGVNDRVDALLNIQPPVNQTHRYLAAINYTTDGMTYYPITSGTGSEERRAQVIAQFDYLRSELPDVFFLNAFTSDGGSVAGDYPFNFAAPAYPTPNAQYYSQYYVPLGNASLGLPFDINLNLVPNNFQTPNTIAIPYVPPATTGIFGASFPVIGGLTKSLGYGPQGYDGVDNNQNYLVDELAEGAVSNTLNLDATAFASHVATNLNKHNHKTAGAEMIDAILVGGLGPLGSVFNADEFTNREVQDTDGDGLPEFVDAWGEPLQFFRWPIYFGGSSVAGASDIQKGSDAYSGFPEVRQLDPLDPNQLLVGPGWWSSAGNPAFPTATNTSTAFSPSFQPPNGQPYAESQAAIAFMSYFHILVDPYPNLTSSSSTSTGTGWDRSGSYPRRAYFSKFLVLSAGPDKEPGVAQFAKDYVSLAGGPGMYTFPNSSLSMDQNATALIFIENQASQTDPTVRTRSYYELPDQTANPTTSFLQANVGLDDISNQNIQAPSTGVR